MNRYHNNPTLNLNDQITSLSYKHIKFIKFRIRKPNITFMEATSQLANKQYQNIKVGISFISLIGYDLDKMPTQPLQELTQITKLTSQSLLGKICSPKFKTTLNDIAQNQQFITNIQNNFITVSDALITNETTLTPLIIGITKYNTQFADWVLN